MNAKEKALELYNKMYSTTTHPNSVEIRKECAKQCALIAVEEILTRMLGSRAYSFNEKLFWSEVKSELQSF
jgi:hypothetical protein